MTTEYARSTNQTKFAVIADGQAFILEAERELGAFVHAVASMFNSQAAKQAAEQWLEVLESDVASVHTLTPSFRNITIQAAICLGSSLIKQGGHPLAPSDRGSATRDTGFSACAGPSRSKILCALEEPNASEARLSPLEQYRFDSFRPSVRVVQHGVS